jgi:hypothetical protein
VVGAAGPPEHDRDALALGRDAAAAENGHGVGVGGRLLRHDEHLDRHARGRAGERAGERKEQHGQQEHRDR